MQAACKKSNLVTGISLAVLLENDREGKSTGYSFKPFAAGQSGACLEIPKCLKKDSGRFFVEL